MVNPLKRQVPKAESSAYEGVLGDALLKSHRGRLRHFIVDAESEPVRLFSEAARATSTAGDWYGEHAGKWLIAASRAAWRTDDAEMAERVCQVAGTLCRAQEPDGYLGTYAKEAPGRFTNPEAENGRTWNV